MATEIVKEKQLIAKEKIALEAQKNSVPVSKSEEQLTKRTIVSSIPLDGKNGTEKQKCVKCGVEYLAMKVKYSDGHENITPKRCKVCQTNHLTNLRVDKALISLKHVGNLKLRLSVEQREAIVGVLTNGLNEVYERFQGTAAVSSGFDISKI